MTALSELIERLEKAEGPDRQIDRAIMQFEVDRGAGRHVQLSEDALDCANRFTSSLDAAMMLVPDFLNRRWYIADSDDRSGGRAVAAVYHPADIATLGRIPRSEGATPAIAFCIAALKARCHSLNVDGK